MDEVIKHINDIKNNSIDELKELLSIPSISTNPENKKDIEDCADWLIKFMSSIELENVKKYDTDGHPIVYGEWLKAGDDKLTILIYGHYDVQPVDPIELWNSPPFTPTIVGDNIFARGATDDKGQVLVHLKSIQAHLKVHKKLPINVKIIIEGEEEIGSPNLETFIKDNKDLLKCDYVVVSDTAMYDYDIPSICYALKGLCYMELDVTGPNKDLHSGSYGGAVENPINALANIITKLKDEKGKILIPGFYDDVIELTAKEKEEFNKLPYNEDEFIKELDIEEVFGEEGYTTIERKWTRPTLDCNGIWGGFQGEGAKTVLPSKAGAKISMRLVPDQDPEKIEKQFSDFVNSIAPNSIKINISASHNAKPAITPIDNDAIKAALKSLELGFGIEPVFMREGGSIPVVNTFQDLLGASAILLGFGLPSENTHSPNEHFNLNNFHRGILTSAYYLDELSKIKN
jgi:acetylornithine deacetylase/succinyl-diaminopimelate desuccinylase-like protein